jgi:hypothetical protein
MRPFIVSCFWLGIKDQTFYAYSAEAVMAHIAREHELEFYNVDFMAAEDDDSDADFYDLWHAYFEGQRWSNGDWNPEMLRIQTPAMEDVALPC